MLWTRFVSNLSYSQMREQKLLCGQCACQNRFKFSLTEIDISSTILWTALSSSTSVLQRHVNWNHCVITTHTSSQDHMDLICRNSNLRFFSDAANRDVISILSYSTVYKLELKSTMTKSNQTQIATMPLEMTLPWKYSVRKEESSSPCVALSSLIREIFLLYLLRCLALKQVSCSIQSLLCLQQFQETKSCGLWVRMCLQNYVQFLSTPHLHSAFIFLLISFFT
jgi:hypothetical protein